MSSPSSAIAAVAALAEPIRRDLFELVVSSRDLVSREQAATAVGIATHTAKFHLDRLVDEGLLEVEFKRLSGRTGPGSGRPTKLYRRAKIEVAVSLPERHYDLLSRILAKAVVDATETGADVAGVAAEVARTEGEAWGAQITVDRGLDEVDQLAAALTGIGYEPWVEEDTLFLRNCPFHRVAQEQTALVCGLNLEFVKGVSTSTQCASLDTRLDPAEGRCCVSSRKDDRDDC